jgi:biotin carboxyl carrier protein
MEFYYECGDQVYKIEVEQNSDTYTVSIGENSYNVSVSSLQKKKMQFTVNGSAFMPRIYANGQQRFVFLQGETYRLKRALRFSTAHDHVEGEILSPIGGKVIKVYISEGDVVEKNNPLLIIESMKMEHKIKAPMKGTVMRLHVGEETIVDMGEVLVDLERDKSTNGQAEW